MPLVDNRQDLTSCGGGWVYLNTIGSFNCVNYDKSANEHEN